MLEEDDKGFCGVLKFVEVVVIGVAVAVVAVAVVVVVCGADLSSAVTQLSPPSPPPSAAIEAEAESKVGEVSKWLGTGLEVATVLSSSSSLTWLAAGVAR